MKTNTFKHPDQKFLIPSIHIVIEKVGKDRYLIIDFVFLNRTLYATFRIK